jgi:hypothetical protein
MLRPYDYNFVSATFAFFAVKFSPRLAFPNPFSYKTENEDRQTLHRRGQRIAL